MECGRTKFCRIPYKHIKKNIYYCMPCLLMTNIKFKNFLLQNNEIRNQFIKCMDDDYKLEDINLSFNLDKWLTIRAKSKNLFFIIIYNNNYIASCNFYYRLTDKLFEQTAESFPVKENKYIHISQVLVNPKYRNRKICQYMLNKLISKLIRSLAKELNAEENILFALRVENNNIAAIKCYENVGFYKIGNISNINYMVAKVKVNI